MVWPPTRVLVTVWQMVGPIGGWTNERSNQCLLIWTQSCRALFVLHALSIFLFMRAFPNEEIRAVCRLNEIYSLNSPHIVNLTFIATLTHLAVAKHCFFLSLSLPHCCFLWLENLLHLNKPTLQQCFVCNSVSLILLDVCCRRTPRSGSLLISGIGCTCVDQLSCWQSAWLESIKGGCLASVGECWNGGNATSWLVGVRVPLCWESGFFAC